MKTLTHLTAIAADAPPPPSTHSHQAGLDLGGGRFFAVRLSTDGLLLVSGPNQIAIPMNEILALAQQHFAPAP